MDHLPLVSSGGMYGGPPMVSCLNSSASESMAYCSRSAAVIGFLGLSDDLESADTYWIIMIKAINPITAAVSFNQLLVLEELEVFIVV